jgi:acetyl-CoA carboxylase biotin carboxyl carrier protein
VSGKNGYLVIAEESGKIVAFHLENEDPVMAGQPIYDLEV